VPSMLAARRRLPWQVSSTRWMCMLHISLSGEGRQSLFSVTVAFCSFPSCLAKSSSVFVSRGSPRSIQRQSVAPCWMAPIAETTEWAAVPSGLLAVGEHDSAAPDISSPECVWRANGAERRGIRREKDSRS